MAANNELSELERHIFDYLKRWSDLKITAGALFVAFSDEDEGVGRREVDQAIANLIAANYIIGSATTPITYTAN